MADAVSFSVSYALNGSGPITPMRLPTPPRRLISSIAVRMVDAPPQFASARSMVRCAKGT